MNLFTDRNGNQTILQFPNLLLLTWILLKLIDVKVEAVWLSLLAAFVLMAWALLEILRGDSYFRRALGLIFLVLSSISILRILS